VRTARLFAALALVAVALSGCAVQASDADAPSSGEPSTTLPPGAAAPSDVTLPPVGAAPDYQLGGPYDPAPGVGVVARDRTAEPADVYSICYLNGFQTQPGERGVWPSELLLRDDAGQPVIDPNWPDEVLLDTSSEATRDGIVAIVEPWIAGCADAGFRAVEFDNLDTYARSDGALTFDVNLALAARLVEIAHAQGLAAGQKNAAEDSRALRDGARFDFAVTEECAAFDECDAYTAVYGEHVIAIEYTDALDRPFSEVCSDPRTPASTVLRDRELTTPSSPDHVFEVCARA
jgi:hypothetical protein